MPIQLQLLYRIHHAVIIRNSLKYDQSFRFIMNYFFMTHRTNTLNRLNIL
jgi:hypothetical protein